MYYAQGDNDDRAMLQQKRSALNALLEEDKMALSVDEVRHLMQPRFHKVMLETKVAKDSGQVSLYVREWVEGVDTEEEFVHTVMCLNQWRSGDLVRKKMIKTLIEATTEPCLTIPLQVTYVSRTEGSL